jgi:gamma-glutamyltranspeptidase / glutathione hydrolase
MVLIMFTTRPELAGTFGMVATTHWLASGTAMAVLENGGNAFDAAVAAAFVLQVAEPHLNGPAGQVPILFATAADPAPRLLSGQGGAPAAATAGHFSSLGLDLIPGSGLLPATVPGAWDAWLLLLRDHGTRPLRDVLGYAMSYAACGVPVVPRLAMVIGTVSDLFTRHWPTSAAQWLPGGRPPAPGSLHRNPELAQTWQRLLAEAECVAGREAQIDAARRAWSQGFVADAVDAFARQRFRDSTGDAQAGLLTGQDMANWQAGYEEPVVTDFGPWSLVKCGGWTQGPVLAQQLLLLEGLLDDVPYPDGVPTARTVHLATECAKLAFADREAWYGDNGEVPVGDLLSREYAAARRALIRDEPGDDLCPGAPGGRPPRLPRLIAEGPGRPDNAGPTGEPITLPTGATRGDTVHLSVVDAAGNMVSATPSGGWLQSSPAIAGLGFCLDTRAQAFWLEQGLPNSLTPGKRPRTTLSPSMALFEGQPALAFGTPGGDQQDQWQLCFWLAYTRGGLNLQESIDAPAWHTGAIPSSFYPRSWNPRQLIVESRLGDQALAELRARGHQVVDAGPWAFGGLAVVAKDHKTGVLRAAANPRGMQGYAAGR